MFMNPSRITGHSSRESSLKPSRTKLLRYTGNKLARTCHGQQKSTCHSVLVPGLIGGWLVVAGCSTSFGNLKSSSGAPTSDFNDFSARVAFMILEAALERQKKITAAVSVNGAKPSYKYVMRSPAKPKQHSTSRSLAFAVGRIVLVILLY
ncbi:hypothetical protein B0H13DRAFT_1890155 [Mycena leptocephala]|nr:hypothetical protein B0H13DRAFT_1890155 [Mycena leptocephala]